MKSVWIAALALGSAAVVAPAAPAAAATCLGSCGTLGANGVVSAPDATHTTYQYITTANGKSGAGQIAGVGGTNGSQLTSDTFTAQANDPLSFMFNYVTSDGAGYADYAWAELRTATGSHVAWLFTARTEASGNISPGVGLPADNSTLNPTATPITKGTAWSPLGTYSGACWASGCGSTGWIQSTYNIATAGTYEVVYGVTNWGDTFYDSGLAFDQLTVSGRTIATEVKASVAGVPEPAVWAMLLVGFAMLGAAMRRRRETMRLAYA